MRIKDHAPAGDSEFTPEEKAFLAEMEEYRLNVLKGRQYASEIGLPQGQGRPVDDDADFDCESEDEG
jgi:hypothetical protein